MNFSACLISQSTRGGCFVEESNYSVASVETILEMLTLAILPPPHWFQMDQIHPCPMRSLGVRNMKLKFVPYNPHLPTNLAPQLFKQGQGFAEWSSELKELLAATNTIFSICAVYL